MKKTVRTIISLSDARRYALANPILKSHRFVDDLELLVVAGIARLFDDAGISYPLKHGDISLYLGLDCGIEEIKNRFLRDIINGGISMASPLLFPYTAPNTIAARATILFGIQGECLTFPVKNSPVDVLKYISTFLIDGTERGILGYINTYHEKREEGTITLAYIEDNYNLHDIEKTVCTIFMKNEDENLR